MSGAAEVQEYLRQVAHLLQRTASSLADSTASAAGVLAEALREGRTVLLCGNGGSAALAQHMACELVGRMRGDHPPWSAVALSSDSAVVTALGNDFGFEAVFARQVRALGKPGDVLVAVSTSGASPNVLAAARAARERDIAVIGLTGGDGGQLANLCSELLAVPSDDTPQVQEVHAALAHAICTLVQAELARTPGGEAHRTQGRGRV
jgi:D-sedoheptulose 7-phosphate isomerase